MQYGEDSPLYGDETVSRRDRVGTCMQTRYRCRFRTSVWLPECQHQVEHTLPISVSVVVRMIAVLGGTVPEIRISATSPEKCVARGAALQNWY